MTEENFKLTSGKVIRNEGGILRLFHSRVSEESEMLRIYDEEVQAFREYFYAQFRQEQEEREAEVSRRLFLTKFGTVEENDLDIKLWLRGGDEKHLSDTEVHLLRLYFLKEYLTNSPVVYKLLREYLQLQKTKPAYDYEELVPELHSAKAAEENDWHSRSNSLEILLRFRLMNLATEALELLDNEGAIWRES